MNAGVALYRDALYYPFIHITDVNWLKATLLCFPGVRRMVPQSYVPTDSDAVREFCDVEGPRGEPLLTRVDLSRRTPRRPRSACWLRWRNRTPKSDRGFPNASR
jgi:hypothetical protein